MKKLAMMGLLLLVASSCTMSNSERLQKIEKLQQKDISLSLDEQQNVMLNSHEERIQTLESTNNIDATLER